MIAEIMNLKVNWIKGKKELIFIKWSKLFDNIQVEAQKNLTPPLKKKKRKGYIKGIYIYIYIYIYILTHACIFRKGAILAMIKSSNICETEVSKETKRIRQKLYLKT